MKSTLKLFSACFTAIGLTLTYSASAQVTVISTLQNNSGFNFFNSFSDMAAWTQTSSYSHVSISAMLDGGGGVTSGTFYLMNQVGPGTTTANELASTAFSVSDIHLVTLFSDLTLGPGTYYLVGSGSGPGGWELTIGNETVTTAPDTSLAINNFRAQNFDPYGPANSFSSFAIGNYPYNLEFLVAAVPEPSAVTLFAAGGISLLAFRRLGRRNRHS